MKIADHTLHRIHLPLPESIGDSQVRFDDHWLTILELHTDDNHTGLGFQLQQGTPIPGLPVLEEQFRLLHWPALHDSEPLGQAIKIQRPRGGNVGRGLFCLPVETALWDLVGKNLGLPLYRVFGGTDPKIPAYGSTLDFHLEDDAFSAKINRFIKRGLRAIKIKVGHPDLQWDLRRLEIVRDLMGSEIDLMVDANEAWTVKQTMSRLGAYRDAGHRIYWVEDPIDRNDLDGYAVLCRQLSDTRVNTGEYHGYSGKRKLLEHHAVDVVQLHDSVQVARQTTTLAGEYGVPVAFGNTILETGVHLAATMPECLYLEFSDCNWNELAAEPVKVQDGVAIAPDRPGHGIELDRDRLKHFSKP